MLDLERGPFARDSRAGDPSPIPSGQAEARCGLGVYLQFRLGRELPEYDGKWVLETNDDTLRLEEAAEGYKGLMVIERCFRSLKRTQIHVSPLHHWLPRRIEAHVKVCVLSLLIERVMEHRCGQPWSR
ncbi:MAG: hypothetical protein ACLFUP_07525, partial [Desulfobacteraceae bacterium]